MLSHRSTLFRHTLICNPAKFMTIQNFWKCQWWNLLHIKIYDRSHEFPIFKISIGNKNVDVDLKDLKCLNKVWDIFKIWLIVGKLILRTSIQPRTGLPKLVTRGLTSYSSQLTAHSLQLTAWTLHRTFALAFILTQSWFRIYSLDTLSSDKISDLKYASVSPSGFLRI